MLSQWMFCCCYLPALGTWTKTGCPWTLGVVAALVLIAPCHGSDLVDVHLLRGRTEAAYKEDLQRQAVRKVEETRAACQLSPEQTEKLRLMALGDVNRAMQRLSALRHAARNINGSDPRQVQSFRQLIVPFAAQEPVELNGKGSLFAKHLEYVLDESQQAQYRQYLERQKKERHHFIVLNVVATLDEQMPLLKTQRQRLVELIDQRPIPNATGVTDLVLVHIRMSSIPEEELKEFLDEEQIKFIARICASFRGIRKTLP